MTDRVETPPPLVRLLYVSTLDAIVSVMLPHLDAARARGWRVEVACRVTRFRADLDAHADVVHDLPFQRFPLHPANLIALARLTALMRWNRYDIVHSHNPTGGFVGRLAATLAGTGALRFYTAHGFHFQRHGRRLTNAIYRAIETFAGRFLSDAVLVINQEDYDAALRGAVVPKSRLFLTGGVGVSARDDFDPARVPPDTRAAIRHDLGILGDGPLLTVVGEMIPRKRHADVLRAFAYLTDRFPGAVLALVGDGALKDRLETLARELGVARAVRFPGFRRDVAAILSATDVFVFPSQQEGLPCAIQEALSMGVPVVATDVRGCADLVDAQCGRLVAPGDVEALGDAMSELIEAGPQARARMGKAGRLRMLDRYERSACVSEWQAIYDKLLEGRANADRIM